MSTRFRDWLYRVLGSVAAQSLKCMNSLLKTALACVCLASPLAHLGKASTIFLATGQAGAQTQIDIDHTSTWQFTSTEDSLIGGGLFTMKAGQNTGDDV